MQQLNLLKQIDDFFLKGIKSADLKNAQSFIENFNNKDYFFAKASLEWLPWLYKNGFFDILNVEAEDKTRYSFGMPELNYLMRVAELNGNEEKIVEVIESVKCNENFNPEVVDRFLWIATKLSVEQLVKVVQKIKKENWVQLMRKFNISEYSYELIVKKLVKVKEYESLLILAEEFLVLNKEKEELDFYENYFYFGSVGQSGIIEALDSLDDIYAEKGIKLIVDILSKLSKEKNDAKDDSSFKYKNGFYIADLDLFNISVSLRRRSNDREDIKSLIAVFVTLIKNRIGKSCDRHARKIYNKYIKILPDSQYIWKMKIFAMSLCPKVFWKDLKTELVRIFDTEHYINFLHGPEYYRIIKMVFPDWSAKEQRVYVEKVLEYFKEEILKFPDKNWVKKYGWKILSSVENELTEQERVACKEYFGKVPDSDFKPQPHIGEITSGVVQDRSPVNMAKYVDIADLIKNLKGKLSPETLKEEYKDDDFLKPRNAEGVGNALKENMKQRMSEYLQKAEDFLDTEINIHYTYSFLRAVEEYLRDKQKLNDEDWDGLFKLFKRIKEANKSEFQENSGKEDDRWLARWVWIEKMIAEILKYFLTEDYSDLFVAKRGIVLELLEYLLESEDPTPENEITDYGDLLHIAINSTRGVAFHAFVNFIYQDGEELKDDVIELYTKTIKKASPSVRFVVGRSLASFYFRDKAAVAKLFDDIFLKGEGKYKDFFAAWEGYLSFSIYKELFEELQEYYAYALEIDSSLYPKRHEREDLDKGIANHLALAFGHFDEVQYTEKDKHPLLKTLWSGNDVKKQKEFVSFLGRGVISRENIDEKKVNKEKLEDFWALILSRDDLDEVVYSGFGFWVKREEDMFEHEWLANMMAKTLEKSKGKIDWEFGVVKKLPEFVKVNSQAALVILEKYLFEEVLGDSQNKKWFHLNDEKISIFEELYKLKQTETTELINKLLEKGGRPFWPLKDIVEG